MADPFEVRMRFTSQLQHLNASVISAQRAAHYALKNRDMDEDLHSCILEQLEKNSLNNRANIMYFMEHLADAAERENHLPFIAFMKRDMLRIIDLVAPDDGSGAANVKVVRKVLAHLQTKNYLQADTVTELEECIRTRDQMASGGAGPEEEKLVRWGHTNGEKRLDKKQIEQRIEEDRERHKRARESVWVVPATDELEMARMWDETSDADEHDITIAAEDDDERAGRAQLHRADMLSV